MKANRCIQLMAMALGLTAISAEGFNQKGPADKTVSPPSRLVVMVTVTPPHSVPVNTAVAAGSDIAFARWSEIKDYTYDARAQFFAGLRRLESKADGQIAELTAKRTTMTGSTSTKEWDFVMKEMVESRAYLKSMGEESHQATAETWDQQKDKVGLAWVRTQDAYAKVKASTTS